MPCFQAYPEKAFQSGSYDRSFCAKQMDSNVSNKVVVEGAEDDPSLSNYRKIYRACEFSCPVGR